MSTYWTHLEVVKQVDVNYLDGMADAETRLAPHRDRVAALERDLERARRARDEEVLACMADNVPVADIARGAGLSRQAVYDIASR